MNDRNPNPQHDHGQTLASGLTVLVGVLLSVAVRLIPHPWNFAPVGALSLFCGSRLPTWRAFAIPFGVLASTDLAIYYLKGDPTDPYVYLSYAFNILLGRWLLQQTSSPWRIGTVTLLAAVQFFLVTNLGAWLTLSKPPHNMYSPTLEGLVQSYVMAIPFARGSFLGDLVFGGVFFGLYAVLAHRLAVRAPLASLSRESRS